jgi:23S rRNA (guanine745-N1)-methyltransferase
MPAQLLCTVRDCPLPLIREAGRLVCARGHSFDVARSGYVNLLQPQDRRSKHPGDSAAAVAARRRLHDRGITAPLLAAVSDLLAGSSVDTVLDAGCGEGFYLGNLAQQAGFCGHGIDISTRAVDAAARRYPGCEWVAGNADRFIPWADASFSAVLSITGRMNAEEFRRVLNPGGRLLVAVAAPDDLIELRGTGRDRVESTRAAFEANFTLHKTARATTQADLNAAAVDDVLHSIYRPLQPQPAHAMRLTFSLDLLLFDVRADSPD